MDMTQQDDIDLYNYYALIVLEKQNNLCPSQHEIDVIEQQLRRHYPHSKWLLKAIEVLTPFEFAEQFLMR